MSIDRSQVKVIESPRISINKLGEYLVASPDRRRTIIRDQKYKKTFIAARYTEAENAIAEYIVAGMTEDDLLLNEADRLLNSAYETEWQAQTAALCSDAIVSFLDMSDDIQSDNCVFERGEQAPPKLQVAKVEISVRPEIILRDEDGQINGGIKLYFAKTNPLNEESGKRITTVLHRYLVDVLESGVTVKPKMCLVVDVFAGEVYPAPKSYKRTMNDVEAACEEIAVRWPSIEMR